MNGRSSTQAPHSRPRGDGHHRGGVTLLELVVVMAIIALLAGVAMPGIGSMIRSQREDETAMRMEEINKGTIAYARDHLAVPRVLANLSNSTGRSWRGPYIQESLKGTGPDPDFKKDVWGRAFRWRRVNSREGRLTSAGANGRFGDGDDLALTIDIRPVLREITLERMERINTAIRNYNAKHQNTKALTGNASTVLRELKRRRYLPNNSSYDRDAFGDAWLLDGSPVTAAYSRNLLNGNATAAGGGGRGSRSGGSGGRGRTRGRSRGPGRGRGR